MNSRLVFLTFPKTKEHQWTLSALYYSSIDITYGPLSLLKAPT